MSNYWPGTEALADAVHQIWRKWAADILFHPAVFPRNPDGSITIPAKQVERWTSLYKYDYDDLNRAEQARIRRLVADNLYPGAL